MSLSGEKWCAFSLDRLSNWMPRGLVVGKQNVSGDSGVGIVVHVITPSGRTRTLRASELFMQNLNAPFSA